MQLLLINPFYHLDPTGRSLALQSVSFSPESTRIVDLLSDEIAGKTVDALTLAEINDEGDGIFVDDEGFIDHQGHFVLIAGMHQPFAGRAVFAGVNEHGDTIEPKAIDETWVRKFTAMITGDKIRMWTDPDDPQSLETFDCWAFGANIVEVFDTFSNLRRPMSGSSMEPR